MLDAYVGESAIREVSRSLAHFREKVNNDFNAVVPPNRDMICRLRWDYHQSSSKLQFHYPRYTLFGLAFHLPILHSWLKRSKMSWSNYIELPSRFFILHASVLRRSGFTLLDARHKRRIFTTVTGYRQRVIVTLAGATRLPQLHSIIFPQVAFVQNAVH